MLATRIIQAGIARQATYWYSYGEVHSKQEFDVKRATNAIFYHEAATLSYLIAFPEDTSFSFRILQNLPYSGPVQPYLAPDLPVAPSRFSQRVADAGL